MTIGVIAFACFIIGVVIRLLRRLPRLLSIATLLGAGLLISYVVASPSQAVTFLGRTLTFDDAARAWIALFVGTAAVLALFGALTFERATNVPSIIIQHSQGAFFFWALAPFVIALAIDSFSLAVFCWAIGLIVLMLAAYPQTEGRVGGAAQFLLITVIAGASLLLANRFVVMFPLAPENLDLLRGAVVFLALGLGLLLAAFPFSLWLSPLADEMPLLGIAFLVSVAQPVGVWLLLHEVGHVRWLFDRSPLPLILLWGGLLTAPAGAVLALSERRDGRLLAYLSLVPLAYTLLGLGLGTRAGLYGALSMIFSRAVGVALMAGGMTLVRHHAERRWQSVGALAIMSGGLALAGVPPTLGFAGQFSLYHDLSKLDSVYIGVMLASSALALLVALRTAWRVMIDRDQAQPVSRELKIVPYLCTLVIGLLLMLVIVAGLFPQIVANPLAQVFAQAAYLK